jgi:hypothetical protein
MTNTGDSRPDDLDSGMICVGFSLLAVILLASCSSSTTATTRPTGDASTSSSGSTSASTGGSSGGAGGSGGIGGSSGGTGSLTSSGGSTSSTGGSTAIMDASTGDSMSDALAPQDALAGSSAVIDNSGSTNVDGFTITVTRDGRATWQNERWQSFPPTGPNPFECLVVDASVVVPPTSLAHGTTKLDPALTSRFFADLAAVPLTSLQFRQCFKSVSFGTRTILTYAGSSTPDIECGSSSDANAAALTRDVNDIERAIIVAGCG